MFVMFPSIVQISITLLSYYLAVFLLDFLFNLLEVHSFFYYVH